MKKAIYRNEDGRERELYVIKENDDGTVELGSASDDDKALVVGKCPIATYPGQGGACTGEGLKAPKDKTAAKTAEAPIPAKK